MQTEPQITFENMPGSDALRARIQEEVAHLERFAATNRQLQDQIRVKRADVKSDDKPAFGVVASLHPEDGFGFIAAADGTEVYFHLNVIPGKGFDKLKPGTKVRYVAREGEKGLQPHVVHIIEH